MNNLRDILLGEIKAIFKNKWQTTQARKTNSKLEKKYSSLMPQLSNAAKRTSTFTDQFTKYNRELERLTAESNDEFEANWRSQIETPITNQFDILYTRLEEDLIAKHPWLNEEQRPVSQSKSSSSTSSEIFVASSNQRSISAPRSFSSKPQEEILPKVWESLKDHFLSTNLEHLLFLLLKDKPGNARTWADISSTFELKWTEIDENAVVQKWLEETIKGYPLSDNSFYDERIFPSYLDKPFIDAPKRIDIYRLLKKSYITKFTPTRIGNGFCTKIAPFTITELSKLSNKEKEHLETILVNVNTEEAPEWVLLNKESGRWILYVPKQPDEIYTKCSEIPGLSSYQTIEVSHLSMDVEYEDLTIWHAILLSRVLPWTQRPETQAKLTLEKYRSTIPVELLLQNIIESSCLPAQEKFEIKSLDAFTYRYPLSNASDNDLYNAPDAAEEYLIEPKYIPRTPANIVIQAFDEQIAYDPLINELTINNSGLYIEALKLTYYKKISTLIIHCEAPSQNLDNLFSYNLSLTKIQAPSSQKFSLIHACAARNRFLIEISSDYLDQGDSEIAQRQYAWIRTGEMIAEFLNTQPQDKEQIKNIAEMGHVGLHHLFNYLNDVEEPATLSCALSLDSGKTCSIQDYISDLIQKISEYSEIKGTLFNKLSLILPRNIHLAGAEFQNLIEELNYSQDISEVTLENSSVITEAFIDKLTAFVEENKICLQIIIPEFDNIADDPKRASLIAKYRDLQNAILKNIRESKQDALTSNTDTIYNPKPVINRIEDATTPDTSSEVWSTTNTYQLSSASAGVQQEAQQEVQQEVQQDAQQQFQPKAPVSKIIEAYDGSEEALITRDNCINLALFLNSVGSKKVAPFIIQKMDKAAYDHIEQYKDLFKFGIDWEHTPGFKLYYSKQNSNVRILTYDNNYAEEDQINQKQNLEPFAIETNDIIKARAFYGDYRQLEPLISEEQGQLDIWHHTAKEELASKPIAWLQSNHLYVNTSESLQYLHIHKVKKDASIEHGRALEIIKEFTQTIEDIDNQDDFLTNAIDKLTPENLKAFGQLFYRYGENGNKDWLTLSYDIYTKFPGKFEIYQKRLLDTLEDWSECLEQTEVEALTASMQKLESHTDYQDILWKLIDIHGGNVGRMRYAEVWNAYEAVIDYINANELQIDKQQFLDTIDKYKGKFNATQFLRRIHAVLHHTGNRQDSFVIQQEILNNLSTIDWNEDGFYYACMHENYRYWDKDLELQDLDKLDGSQKTSYISTWDDISLNDITNPKAYTLRYAAQKLKMNKTDFNKFKAVIEMIDTQCSTNKKEVMKLAVASIALGIDTVDSLLVCDFSKLSDPKYASGLNNIHQRLLLDTEELINKSYHVRMQDMHLLLTETKSSNIILDDLDKINACGRALQCCDESQFKKLLTHINTQGFDHLAKDYPWLIENPIIETIQDNNELLIFYNQLRTIDFSGALPDKDELTTLLLSITTKQSRREAIQSLISKGSSITDQDADFRFVTTDEARMINDIYLSKPFKKQNNKLLTKLFEKLAIKQDGDTNKKIQYFLSLLSDLDKKIYYDELGQLLGLLVEQAKDKHYSIEQLSMWLKAVFDVDEFKKKPYPVALIKELLIDALESQDSSLLNSDLDKLKTHEENLSTLKDLMSEINLLKLSDQAKKTLAKYVIKFKSKTDEELRQIYLDFKNILNNLNHSPQVTTTFCNFITQELNNDSTTLLDDVEMLEKLTEPCQIEDKKIQQLSEQNQIKLLTGLKTKTFDQHKISALRAPNPWINLILAAACKDSGEDEIVLITSVQKKLLKLNSIDGSQLEILAKYYTTDPKPTLLQLDYLLTTNNAVDMINHFEMIMQPDGKRDYSLDEEDLISLKRVISGFKLKHQANITNDEQTHILHLLSYINTYSYTMRLEQKFDEELLEIIRNNTEDDSDEAKAQILACMREIIVRKTRKWVKHTQMIDLIYGAIHNNESLMHQVRMGEGKSLISLERIAYRALHGQIVDVYSSKESLSARDHKEFGIVLDAFGIRNSYITERLTRDQYHDKVDDKGVGAVHYATNSGFNLFLTGILWANKKRSDYINVHAENRCAILDEGDAILNQTTLHQLPCQTGANSIYNYDAWVYRLAYEYYQENQQQFIEAGFNLKEDPDLKNLYIKLQKGLKEFAPKESQFFKQYLASGDTELRNQKLFQLITATHLAQGMIKDVNFCVMDEQKKIDNAVTIAIRVAKVMIENQICHGSNFSELVHQVLHTILNMQAVELGETPNFFIEPESEIALSLNTDYTLINFYKRIEAFTGTAGDKKTTTCNQKKFKINRVIKLPTHKDIKTIFQPPIYCKGEHSDNLEEQKNNDIKAHVEAILESISRDLTRPILITCKDDQDVLIIGHLIQQELQRKPSKYGNRILILDTNNSGLNETESLAKSGQNTYISLSSRAGRGSDIKVQDEKAGLRVIRTYPATPDVVKQEQGRQGRNGAGGECQEILNYGEIERELDKVQDNEVFKQMLIDETSHLDLKLTKHQTTHKENKMIWHEIATNKHLKEQYLKTRTLQLFNAQILKESKKHIRYKESLLIEGSALVMDKLHTLEKSQENKIKANWRECRKLIEKTLVSDSEPTYSRRILEEFYLANDITTPTDLDTLSEHIEEISTTDEDISDEGGLLDEYPNDVDIEDRIRFYQKWLEKIMEVNIEDEDIRNELYGIEGYDLEDLYIKFKYLNTEQVAMLISMIESYDGCQYISCKAWEQAITQILSDQDIASSCEARMNKFFAKIHNQPNSVEAIQELDAAFISAVEGEPDLTFIIAIIKDPSIKFLNKNSLENRLKHNFPRKIIELCKHSMNQEDIVFFLRTLENFNPDESDLKYLAEHYYDLKSHRSCIRPLLPLLFQRTEKQFFTDLQFNENTAPLLRFLNNRPQFDHEDYIALDDKINRIEDLNRETFLSLLSAIPPHISISSILDDLSDLPGLDSFEYGNTDLENRINDIKLSGSCFNRFLFDRNIISTTQEGFSNIVNKVQYDRWHDIFSNLPLKNRHKLFTEINKLQHMSIDALETIANKYIGHKNNEQMYSDISEQIQLSNSKPIVSSASSGLSLFSRASVSAKTSAPSVATNPNKK